MRFHISAQGILAVVVVGAFIILVGIWMWRPPSGDQATMALVNALVMVVGSGFMTVLNYYFGSSSGSKDKDETISRMAQTPQQQLPPNAIIPPTNP